MCFVDVSCWYLFFFVDVFGMKFSIILVKGNEVINGRMVGFVISSSFLGDLIRGGYRLGRGEDVVLFFFIRRVLEEMSALVIFSGVRGYFI